MQTFRLERAPGPRHTILQDTRDFTDEPHTLPNSLPHTPTQNVQFLNGPRLPASRRPTEYADTGTPPYIYPRDSNGNIDPQRKWTQEDQDQYDEKTRKKAMSELVQSWMDRLQLISVITTFFAAIEAQLLSSTMPNDPTNDPPLDQAANAALIGALVIHLFAAIISFLAAFFLIRYKLSVAKREERKVEAGHHGTDTVSSSSVWSSNPHLEQVGPFRRGQPPTHLLDHCHSLCMWLSAVGFVLAVAGVMCFAWARFARSAGIFASVCTAVCLVSGVGAFFWPASAVHKMKIA